MKRKKKIQSLYRQLLARTVVFLVLPFLAVVVFLMAVSAKSGKDKYDMNLELITEQVSSARKAHVEAVKKIENRIVTNETLKGFFLVAYSPLSLSYYSSEIRHLVAPGTEEESRYKIRICYENPTIPRGFGTFCRIEDIESSGVRAFLESEDLSRWVMPEEASLYSSGYVSFHQNYTYMRKVMAGEKLVYLMTVSVGEQDMNSFLWEHGTKGGDRPEWRQTKDSLVINYSGIPLEEANGIGGWPMGLWEVREVSVSGFPQQMYLIFGLDEQKGSIYGVMAAVVLLVTGMIVLEFTFIRSIFKRISGCLSGFERSLGHGFDTKLEVHGNNEVTRIEEAFNMQIEKIQELLKLTAKQVSAVKDSQLMALQHQINPHFLYNTLEVFSYRMELYEHSEEADALMSFSKMMRYNIAQSNGYATIRQELTQVDHYLAIQRLKYQKLELEVEIAQELYEFEVLRFLLQPLIENSVQHGYYGELLHIRLSAEQKGDYVWFEVYDDGCGVAPERVKEINRSLLAKEGSEGLGVGLSNINERLCLFYSKACGLLMESEEGSWMKLKFCVPYAGRY